VCPQGKTSAGRPGEIAPGRYSSPCVAGERQRFAPEPWVRNCGSPKVSENGSPDPARIDRWRPGGSLTVSSYGSAAEKIPAFQHRTRQGAAFPSLEEKPKPNRVVRTLQRRATIGRLPGQLYQAVCLHLDQPPGSRSQISRKFRFQRRASQGNCLDAITQALGRAVELQRNRKLLANPSSWLRGTRRKLQCRRRS
jgi:hypothetical protein